MTNKNKKRKICFVITSLIHYSRNLLILDELKRRDDVELYIAIGGTALLPKYASRHTNVKEMLISEGFDNIYEVYFNLEGDNNVVKSKTVGLGIIEFSLLFNNINPDLLLVRGDRFEVLAAATAASFMNIPIAHIEGGDVSGTLDESIRHTVTKLSHIHFTTNEPAKKRVLRMGEKKEYVFNFGSPDIEVVHKIVNGGINIDLSKTGSGADIDSGSDFLMIMHNPVTTELKKTSQNTKMLLEAIYELDIPTLWFWPNADSGAEDISRELRIFKDSVRDHKVRFMRYLPPKEFLSLLKNTKCLVGNSSAGIKECSYLGVPVVNIGSRQSNRLHADNVMDTGNDKKEIKEIIMKQINIGRYPTSDLYKIDNTSKKIAEKLATIELYIQKSFEDLTD